MRKEAAGKKKNWLWLVIALAVLLIGGTVAAVMLLGGGDSQEAAPVVTEPTVVQEKVRPDLYWNVDRHVYAGKSETGLSSREPEADGLYHFRFAYNGQLLEYTAKDKKLVNTVDSFDLLCLTVDDSGTILDATSFEEKAMLLNNGVYFFKALDGAFVANSSMAMNGMDVTIELSDVLEIYDVSSTATTPGEFADYRNIPIMARIMVYGPEEGVPTHAYVVSHPETSPVYWRVDQMYNRNTQRTTRVPEKGVYSIEFYTGGGKVILQTKDESTANAIDRQNAYNAAFAFTFDEEGYIADTFDSGVAIRGRMACSRMFVTEVNGDTFTAVNRANFTDTGASNFTGTITENTRIYDVSWQAKSENRDGLKVDGLKVDDMITVWTDLEGNVVLIYISNSVVGCPSYYNVTRKYNAQTGTTRTPNAAGYYEFELLSEGTIKTYRTKDKALADYLDSQSIRVVGLKLEGDVIRAVYPHMAVYGFYNIFNNYYVRTVANPLFTVSLTENSTTVNGLMAENCKVIDISSVGKFGSETELRKGDRCMGFVNPDQNYVEIFVVGRLEENSLQYYNITRMFDSTTRTTTRTPDENGWYVFDMAVEGKRVNVKTKSKEIASKIDGYSPQIMGLVVSGDVVQKVFDPFNVTGGMWACSSAYFEGYDGEGKLTVTHTSNNTTEKYVVNDSCRTYNVGLLFDKFQGERTTLRQGDLIMAFTNSNNEVVRAYVRERDTDTLYWNVDPMYDSVARETLRQPDADGYYVFQLAGGGKLRTFKTKDKAIASAVDSYNRTLAIRNDGDIILSAGGWNYVKDLYSSVATDWDVSAINGNRITFKNNRPGYSNTGDTVTYTLGYNARIYDVSPDAGTVGQTTKLKVGDRVCVYRVKDESIAVIFVWAHERKSLCPHCNEEVLWQPYVGDRFMPADGHFYLLRDVHTGAQMGVGSPDYEYELVLDLNGKTTTRLNEGRALMVGYEEKLILMDSAGGGAICGYGADELLGGVVMLTSGGKLDMMGGSIRLLESEYKVGRGGTMYIGGETTVFNMMGGTVEGGVAQKNDKHAAGQGGNIFCYQATINLSGGEITGGKISGVDCVGGNIAMAQDSVLNMTGGKITGGTDAVRGGNIYIGQDAVVNMTAGEISGGSTEYLGGNIYLADGSFLMSGGTVTGGYAGQYGGNFYAVGNTFTVTGGSIAEGSAVLGGSSLFAPATADCDFTFGGGTVDGGLRINAVKSLLLTGNPVITDRESGLSLRAGVLATLGDLTEGTSIFVNATGVFTNPSDKAQAYLDAGYFKSSERNTITVKDNALHMQNLGGDEQIERYNQIYDKAVKMTADGVFSSGRTVEAQCPYCAQKVQWLPLTNASANELPAPTGNNAHYYLAEDITYTGKFLQIPQDSEKMDNFCIHLNGHNITSTDGKAVQVGVGSALNLMGDGIVMGAGEKNVGAALDVYGTANLFGGSYRASADNYVLTARHETSKVVVYNGTKFQVTDNHTCAAVCMATAGSRLYLYGGEVDATGGRGLYLANGKIYQYGGKIYGAANSNVLVTGRASYNMFGGSIEGGTAAGGGNVRLENGTFAMNGEALVSGGTATVVGGNVCVVGGSFLAYGGTIENGTAPSGGNIYLNCETSTVSITENGPTVTGGTATDNGGNIFISSGKLILDVGTVEKGTAVNGDNIWLNGEKASAAITNVELSGGVYINKAENLTLSGKLVIGNEAGGLVLTKGVLANVSGLTEGASIYVVADGIFTTAMDNAQAILDAGYFQIPAKHTISVVDNALSIQAQSAEETAVVCDKVAQEADKMTQEGVFTGETVEAKCPYCLQVVTWQPLKTADGENAVVISGHYYLASDLANTNHYATNGNACLHLNGKSLTTTSAIALHAAAGTELNVMGSGSVTGAGSRATGTLDVKGTVRLMGGTYTATSAYVVAPTAAGAKFYMYNGTVINGISNALSAIVCAQDAQLWLMGGEINANGGRSVHMTAGTAYQYGSKISGAANTNVFLTGSAAYNMFGGTVEGGSAAGGGNVRLEGGSFSMTDTAKLSGGSATVIGGNIYAETGTVNLWGGTIENGTAPNGGNIYINNYATFNMSAAPEGVTGGMAVVSGGTATGKGGNIFVNTGTATLSRGSITNGGICVNSADASLTLDGITLEGDVLIQRAKEVKLSGKLTVGDKNGGLTIQKGILANVDGLLEGASICLMADGIFTTETNQAQTILDMGIFKIPAKHTLTVVDNALSMQALTTEELTEICNNASKEADKMTDEGVFTGQTVEARCPYCLQTVTWQPLEAANGEEAAVLSGHYYLASDLANTNYYVTGGNTCLHLNGKTLTATTAQALQAAAGTELVIMGNGNVSAAGSRTTATLDVQGNMKLMGGTYTATGTYVVAPTAASAKFEMYNGTVINGVSGTTAAIVCSQNAEMRLWGGKINANNCAGIYVSAGKTYLSGANVNGSTVRGIWLGAGNATVYQTAGTVSGSQNSNVFMQAGIYNFIGGSIEGGTAAGGGNVRVEGGTFNMNTAAKLSGGTATVIGGNIYAETGTVNLWGGTVEGGNAPNGGNVYINNNATFYMGTAPEGVTGGDPVVTGGNIVVNSGVLTLTGGTVEGGIYANSANATVNLSGGTVNGGVQLMTVKAASLAGKVTVSENGGGLVIQKGTLVDVSGLEEGASIYLVADGIFTTDTIQAQFVLDADIFKLPPRTVITLEGLALCAKVLTEGDLLGIYNGAAEEADKMTADGIFTGEAVTAKCPYCLETVTWQPLTQASGNVLSSQNGTHYYLAEDITYSGQYLTTEETTEARQFCLHLNGKTFTATDKRAVYVPANHTLNIMGSGIVAAAGEQNRGTLDVDGTVNLMGGTYQATGTNYTTTQRHETSKINVYNGTTLAGGADAFTTVCVATAGSRMDIFGGTVQANGSRGFYVAGGKVFLHNGTVVGGTKSVVHNTGTGAFNYLGGTVTGNVLVEGGTFAMNNTATVTGNVSVTAGSFSLLAGTVTENVLVNGAEASVTLSNCNLPGTVEITAAKAVTLSGKAVLADLKLTAGVLANVSGLTAGTQIGLQAEGVFTTAMDNAQEIIDAGYFTIPIKHILKVKDNAISLQPMTAEELHALYNTVAATAAKMTEEGVFNGGAVEAICPYCQVTVTWQPLEAATGAESVSVSGHYYLASDLTANTNYYVTAGNTCLHLNGKSVTTTAAQAFQVAAGTELAQMGSGTVTAAGSKATGTMDVKGTLKLMGGTYNATTGYVVAVTAANADFCMYEGTVVNGVSGTTSAVVCAQNSRMWLMGGDINANNCAGIYVSQGKTYLAGTDVHGSNQRGVWVGAGNATVYHSAGTVSGSQNSNVFMQAGIYNFTGGTIEDGSAAGGGNVRLEGGTFNMNGNALLTGGTATAIGGNIYAENATINVWGGTIEDGSAPNGGNIYLNSDNTVFYMGPAPQGVTGGNPAVTGGTATTGAGGNFYVGKGTLNLAGGTVEQGMAGTNGGNIYLAGTATLSGGTVSGGTAGNNGGNIYADGRASLTLSGAVVSGGIANGAENERQYYYNGGGNIYVGASASMTMTDGKVESGIATHNSGGNILARGTVTLSGGTVEGGHANYIGGNIMNGAGKLTLSGVTVSGGTGDKGDKNTLVNGDNVASFGGTLTVSGGTILADSDAQGNAIVATYNAKVILDGAAQITNEAAAGNIYMDTQATLQVLATFTGKAGIVFHPNHGATYGATLTNDTSTGVFSGILYLEDLNGAKVQGTTANTLVVEAQP